MEPQRATLHYKIIPHLHLLGLMVLDPVQIDRPILRFLTIRAY